MSLSWTSAGTWLLHCAVGGGMILLVTCLCMRLTRQPAQRQRLGELGALAALGVALVSLWPAWLEIPWPAAGEPAAEPAAAAARAQPRHAEPDPPPMVLLEVDPNAVEVARMPLPETAPLQPEPMPDTVEATTPFDWRPLVVGGLL